MLWSRRSMWSKHIFSMHFVKPLKHCREPLCPSGEQEPYRQKNETRFIQQRTGFEKASQWWLLCPGRTSRPCQRKTGRAVPPFSIRQNWRFVSSQMSLRQDKKRSGLSTCSKELCALLEGAILTLDSTYGSKQAPGQEFLSTVTMTFCGKHLSDYWTLACEKILLESAPSANSSSFSWLQQGKHLTAGIDGNEQ